MFPWKRTILVISETNLILYFHLIGAIYSCAISTCNVHKLMALPEIFSNEKQKKASLKFNINHSNTVDLQTRTQTIACAGYLLIQISQSTLIIKSPSPWKFKKKIFLRTSIFANQKKIFTYTNFQKLSKNILLLVHIFCKNDKHLWNSY